MHIRVKYFGQITEATQLDEETLECSGQLISDFLEVLHLKHISLKKINFKIAQNQELVSVSTKLTGEDIALLPPFAGG